MLTLWVGGFQVWFLTLAERFDPNTVLGAGLVVHLIIPVPLLASAIRSIVRQRAIVERIVNVQDTGTQVITEYYVEIASGL